MSLINVIPITRRYWPVTLFLLLLLLSGIALWYFWTPLLMQTIVWQAQLNREMTQLLQRVAEHPHQAGVTLMLFSLVYGVLHAMGPGHGKVVISTFLATHPARLKTSLKLTLLAALVQGGVAIVLVTVMLVLLKTSSRQLHLSSYWLEKGSYLLIAALGVWVSVRALRSLKTLLQPPPKLTIHSLRPVHQHDANCGCGHAHLPSAEQIAQAVSWKTQLLLVFSMGLRPCSGAIMMLLFAKVIGVYWWGVASAAIMALGTAVTVSAVGLLVHRSRALAQRLGQRSEGQGAKWLLPLSGLLGGLILLVAAFILWQSATPGIGGGISPLGI